MQNIKIAAYALGSEGESDVRKELHQMTLNSAYNTAPSYTPISAKYPDGLIPFVDRHIRYLNANPKLDAWMYIANLRLMTRINRSSI
jgi:hypothetical protein